MSTRSRGNRVAAAVSAVVVAVPLVVAIVTGRPNALEQLVLSGGGAWLASPDRGFVTLIDGPSEQVAATVITGSGGPVSVTQAGSSAFVADDATGTVSRIDGATYEVWSPLSFGERGSDLSVLSGTEAVFVVDGTRRVAAVADPDTLAVRRELSLAATPEAGQSLVDAAGRLWVVDSGGGGLRWFDADGSQGRAQAGPATALVSVGGRAASVDTATTPATVAWLDEDGGRDPWGCPLDSREGDGVVLLGSDGGEEVFAAVPGAGTLVVASTDEGRCGAVVPGVADPGASLGALVQLDRFLFVPDRGTGVVTVVDTATLAVNARLELTEPDNDLELLAEDGIVFYNDLDSDEAGVLRLGAGGFWEAGDALSKYDPTTGAPAEVVTPPDPAAPFPLPGETVDPPQAPGAPQPTVAPPTGPPTNAPPDRSPRLPGPTVGGNPGPPTTPGGGGPPGPTAPGPGPVPVITALQGPDVVFTGGSATFQAAVTNASGAWSWLVTDTQGGRIGAGGSEGAFTVEVPATTPGEEIVVRLTVGRSVARTETFTLAPEVAPVTVPDVVGLPVELAQSRLEALGLGVAGILEEDSPAPAGQVIRSDPPAGTVTSGGDVAVTLVVSTGTAPVVATRTTVRVNGPLWDDEKPTVTVTVEAVDGGTVPQGMVRLALREPDIPPPDVTFAPQALSGGSTTFTPFAIPRRSRATFLAFFEPSDATFSASEGREVVEVELRPRVIDVTCRNDAGSPRFQVTLEEWSSDIEVTALARNDTGDVIGSGVMTFVSTEGPAITLHEWTFLGGGSTALDNTAYSFRSLRTGNDSDDEDGGWVYQDDCLL